MTRKKHINKFLAPTQSRDSPANLFMFMCFFFPRNSVPLRCGWKSPSPESNWKRKATQEKTQKQIFNESVLEFFGGRKTIGSERPPKRKRKKHIFHEIVLGFSGGRKRLEAKSHPRKNAKTNFSRDCPGIFGGFCSCAFSPPQER